MHLQVTSPMPKLYTSNAALLWLLEGEWERERLYAPSDTSGRFAAPGTAIVTPALYAAWSNYETALEGALALWYAKRGQHKLDAYLAVYWAAERMMDGAAVDVYQTFMEGDGGIYDGRWSHTLISQSEIEDLSSYLEMKLSRFVEQTGTGTINRALQNACYE